MAGLSPGIHEDRASEVEPVTAEEYVRVVSFPLSQPFRDRDCHAASLTQATPAGLSASEREHGCKMIRCLNDGSSFLREAAVNALAKFAQHKEGALTSTSTLKT